jgi:hypothetical protein
MEQVHPGLVRLEDIQAMPQGGLYKIDEQTLSADGPNLDIQSIPDDFQDLLVVIKARCVIATNIDSLKVSLNNDTADANYRYQRVQGIGATASAAEISAANSRAWALASGTTSPAGAFSFNELRIRDYASTGPKVVDASVTCLAGFVASGLVARRVTSAWVGTNPVTSIKVEPLNGTALLAGSRMSIYGIRSAFL